MKEIIRHFFCRKDAIIAKMKEENMGKNIKDIFCSIIKENILTENDIMPEEFKKRGSDYRKFSEFLNSAYTSLFDSSKKLSLGKLGNSVYEQIKKNMVALWNDYSYSKCIIWIDGLKDQFRLYYIDEKSNDDKQKQIIFYKQICKILYIIYQELYVDDEKALVRAKEVYENSCKIFSLLEKSIKLSCDPYAPNASDEYSSYTNEKWINRLNELERKCTEKRDTREYLEELKEKVDLLQKIMDGNSTIDKKRYFRRYRELQKEIAKEIIKYQSRSAESEGAKLLKIKNDIKRVAKDGKELDVMEHTPNYIDLINRCCREQMNHPDKDILEIIKEQQEQIKKENI